MLWTCRRRDRKAVPFLTVSHLPYSFDFPMASVTREGGLEGLASYTQCPPYRSPAGGSRGEPGVYCLRELTGQPMLHLAK